jgi:hypothetical protein
MMYRLVMLGESGLPFNGHWKDWQYVKTAIKYRAWANRQDRANLGSHVIPIYPEIIAVEGRSRVIDGDESYMGIFRVQFPKGHVQCYIAPEFHPTPPGFYS